LAAELNITIKHCGGFAGEAIPLRAANAWEIRHFESYNVLKYKKSALNF